MLAGVIAFGLGNLLYPLVYYLNIEITSLISSIIVGIVFAITLAMFFYVNKRSQKKLMKVIHLTQYSKKRLKIRPQSFKAFFFFIFSYSLFFGLTILSWGAFIQLPNAFMLFSVMVSFYLLLLCSFMTVGLGDARVKFIGDKNARHV